MQHFFLFIVDFVGNAYSEKHSSVAQRKDSCLAFPHCCTRQTKEPRKGGEKNTPFLRAIKQSVVKSVRQYSAAKERGTASKMPTAWP